MAFGSYMTYESEQKKAEIEEDNAEYASEAAANKDEQEKLNRRAERKKQSHEQRRKRSLMEAAYAKSGVLLDGTPSNYLTAQTETDQLNVERADQRSQVERSNILYEGQLQANEHLNRAAAHSGAAQSSLIGAVSMAAGTFSSWGDAAPAASGGGSAPSPSGFDYRTGKGQGGFSGGSGKGAMRDDAGGGGFDYRTGKGQGGFSFGG